nr:hypothetical protein [Tanacetum cinerariifolium]
MPFICIACGGIVRGGLCLPYDLREKNLYNYDPNAYSFNNSNYFPQHQDENYLCNLYGNSSHDDYDCQQQFLFVYEQEPSYNQNYDDNYYPHESPSYPCYDYCGGSHETFQCQPDNQNVDFSGSNQIQTPQYLDVNPPSLEINNEEIFQAKGDLMNTDRPIFLNNNEDHPVQNKESLENSSEETVVSKTNQEPPQDSNIHQLIKEYGIKVLEEKKQKMENTIALDSKLLLINSNSQRLDKKEQGVKNVVEQAAKHGNLIAPIQSTKEPEHLLSMGYEHPSITPETKSDEVTEPNVENLLPIPSKCEVTLEDEIECDMPAKDICSPVFTTFSNPLFKDNDDLDSRNDESLPDEDVPAEEFKIYSNSLFDNDEISSDKLEPHCFNVEFDFVESLLSRDTFIDFSSKFDFSGGLAHIKPEIPKFDFDFEEEIRHIKNVLYDNSFPRPPEELNAEIADTIIESIPLHIPVQDGNSQQEEIDIVTKTDDVLPPSVDNDDDSSDDPLLGEGDLFLSDNLIPPGIENVADDPEGDIRFLEELLIDDSLLSDELFDANFEDNPSIPRPPPKPHDVETDAREEIPVVMNDKDEDVDYSSFIFVIYPEMFPFLLFAESEDTIFNPEPENSLSMGYEHLSITPEMESDEVTESNAKNLFPIPSECEVTSEDKRECDELVCDNHSDTFSDSKIDDDISVYDDDFEDIESCKMRV